MYVGSQNGWNRFIIDFNFKFFLQLKSALMRQLPLLALIAGMLLFFILVGCDEDAPGSSAWSTGDVPAIPVSQ